ncbi:MAG: nucleotidyltransferase domain-containing protein [DPANN group archaeon]|nr:nucleotidyltransferase domain-containing protein [DPANN group archaeon]
MPKKNSPKKDSPLPKLPPNATPEQVKEALPKEVQDKLKAIKDKIEKFQKKIVGKFDNYIMGVSLLPPQKKEGTEEVDREKINVLVLIDDSDSTRLSKEALKSKLISIIETEAKGVDKNLKPQVVILSELWQSCYDAKHELLQLVALSAPIYDKGMLAAIKIAETHKTMVLKKFEKYIVSYVLAGSLVQGRATKESDIDVWIVIDDTDVKKMTRAELKDKLRAIIIGMGIEAGEMTGIRNKLNIQIYILTDFWDSLKEANPIIFTLLRDGVPFFDRGMFMPWKQLLKMGKIKPSAEAIDMFMGSGEQLLQRVKFKLRDIGMEDVFYALLTPSQAALMMQGIAPPAPRETPKLMRDIFVTKHHLLEEKFVKTLEKVITLRKDLEHGTRKEVSGKDIDDILREADKYLKRIKRLFTQIEKIKSEEDVAHIYDNVVTIIRDVMKMEGVNKVDDKDIIKVFENELVSLGKIPSKYLRMLNNLIKAKKDYDAGKLTKQEVEQVKKESAQFIKFLVEYMQRKRGRELERAKIRVKHGKKYGEVLLLDTVAYIIHDIDDEEKSVSRAPINKDGSLGTPVRTTLQEMEKDLASKQILPKVFIKEPIFENLRDFFGKDIEILINY